MKFLFFKDYARNCAGDRLEPGRETHTEGGRDAGRLSVRVCVCVSICVCMCMRVYMCVCARVLGGMILTAIRDPLGND